MTLLQSFMILWGTFGFAQAAPQTPAPLPNINHMVYTNKSELFLEYRPLIVGQAVGRIEGNNIQITDGLRDGERIVSKGADKIQLK